MESFEPLPTYLSVRVANSKTDEVAITSDSPSSSHQKSLALKDEVAEVVNPSVQLSPPPTPPTLDIFPDLASKPVCCHVDSSHRPSSSHSVDPSDCSILCSPILESSPVLNEDQVVISHDECV